MISSSEYDSSSGEFSDTEDEEIRQDIIRENMNPRFRGYRRYLNLEENAISSLWLLVAKIYARRNLEADYLDIVAGHSWKFVINESYTDENQTPISFLTIPRIIFETFPHMPITKQLGMSLQKQQEKDVYLHLIPGERSCGSVQTRKINIGFLWQCAAQYHNQEEPCLSESEYMAWKDILGEKLPLMTLYDLIFSMFTSSKRVQTSLVSLAFDKVRESRATPVQNLPRVASKDKYLEHYSPKRRRKEEFESTHTIS